MPDFQESVTETTKYETENLDVKIVAVNGIRITMKGGIHNCIVERLDHNGIWQRLKYVQRIAIELDVYHKLPVITITEIAISEVKSIVT